VSAGGLAVGLVEALRERRGIWFGWSGAHVEPEAKPSLREIDGITQALVDVSADDYDAYYNGYANGCLWPLFSLPHRPLALRATAFRSLPPRQPAIRASVAPAARSRRYRVAHDYHLFPLAAELRALACASASDFSCTSLFRRATSW